MYEKNIIFKTKLVVLENTLPSFGKSSYEIPFATMFVFQKIHVMHSHLISRLPSAYEMHYAISIIFIQIYIKYAYILKFTFTPHVIQSGSNNTQISSLEQITISSPMAYTHNYIPYKQFHLQWPIHTIIFHIIEQIMLTHQAYALTYLFPLNSSHSF